MMARTLERERIERSDGPSSVPSDQQVQVDDVVERQERQPDLPANDGTNPGASALDSAACDALTWLGRELVWQRQLETLRRRRSIAAP
jgi:hypothetical protein